MCLNDILTGEFQKLLLATEANSLKTQQVSNMVMHGDPHSFVLLSKFPLSDNVPLFGEVLLIEPILQHLLCALSISCLQ